MQLKYLRFDISAKDGSVEYAVIAFSSKLVHSNGCGVESSQDDLKLFLM